MAGHNKWSQIKRKKGVTDSEKSKIFGKFSRLITLESKKAGGNLSAPELKAAIDKAKSFNMPNDNIERAIKKGISGESEGLERVIYEAYGPEGVAMIIEGLTANRNKASSEIRHILNKNGGNLGAPGSASWAFTKTDTGWTPNSAIHVSAEAAGTLSNLVEELQNNEEVGGVFTNAATSENTKHE